MNEDLLNVMGSFSELSLNCLEKQNEEIEQLEKENQQLKDRINKAIEYIEDEAYLDYERETSHNLYDSQIFKLIEILKEDNKEE